MFDLETTLVEVPGAKLHPYAFKHQLTSAMHEKPFFFFLWCVCQYGAI